MTPYLKSSRYHKHSSDPLLWIPMYQALRSVSSQKSQIIQHIVQPNEEQRLDLISYRVYGTVSYWWVVAICARVDDPINSKIPASTVLTLPTIATIRGLLKS